MISCLKPRSKEWRIVHSLFWGEVGKVNPPHLVMPITVEPTKPRMCHDERFLNCWIKDCPFSLDCIKDLPRLENADVFFLVRSHLFAFEVSQLPRMHLFLLWSLISTPGGFGGHWFQGMPHALSSWALKGIPTFYCSPPDLAPLCGNHAFYSGIFRSFGSPPFEIALFALLGLERSPRPCSSCAKSDSYLPIFILPFVSLA